MRAAQGAPTPGGLLAKSGGDVETPKRRLRPLREAQIEQVRELGVISEQQAGQMRANLDAQVERMLNRPAGLGVGCEHVIHAPPVATCVFPRRPGESFGPGPLQKSRLGLCVVTMVAYGVHERRRRLRSGFQPARVQGPPRRTTAFGLAWG